MALHPACHAVENYLAAWFPGSMITEFEWAAMRSWAFKVSVPTLTFQLLVSTDFLDKTNDYDIERLLHDWYVASRMRTAGARDWVQISREGVTVGAPEPGEAAGRGRSPARLRLSTASRSRFRTV